MVFYYNLLYNRFKIGARVIFVKIISCMNNKGFMLVETLVVSIFVMSIFSMLYTGILPLLAEYEKYKNYNTVEATYKAHWARKLILAGLDDTSFTTATTNGYLDVSDCSLYSKNNMTDWCDNFQITSDITKIYLTTYSEEKFKSYIKSSDSYTREFKDYINYIPTYSKNSTKANDNKYFHVIVEFNKGNRHNYGIMEVYRK